MAAGADDLLDSAVVVDSLDEALVGCHLILATSARPRGLSLQALPRRKVLSLLGSILIKHR